jgi:phosphoribosyl-ATP pyrophosphohydrolase/phosphoribosyl-AMP cyclohydrolase
MSDYNSINFDFTIDRINFQKGDGLVPVIVQDFHTQKVLMLGYSNQSALEKTLETGSMTFYSRSKQRLWTKGEESGHFLKVKSLTLDCDQDTILAKVEPMGPVCHTGTDTCWGEVNQESSFIRHLEEIIELRKKASNENNSYVASLFAKGINKIAQKVGEEAIELVIESKDNNDELFINEAADLLFHYLILLNVKGFEMNDIIKVLKNRHQK